MFSFTNISSYLQLLQSGQYTTVRAVEFYLQQIKDQERLNAFIEVFANEALEQAEEADRSLQAGNTLKKLHGVVIAIKDVLCYRDHRVSAASKMLEGFESVYTATAVQRLVDEGAIIIGRCNCDEFAMGSSNENSAHGKVLNALDETKVPGGSSGGSAVAVQANMCMASLGSDTGGSVRQPAGFCGIVGMKPSYGRISRYGLIAYASSFDQIGIFSKQVEDVALLLAIMSGKDDFDSTAIQQPLEELTAQLSVDKKFRIAYFREGLTHPSLDPEISAAIFNSIEKLLDAGHTVAPISFDLLDYIVPAYYVLTTAEASSNLSRYDAVRFGHRTKEPVTDLTDFYKRSRTEAFGKEVQQRIMLGTFVLSAGYYDAYFSKAQQVRRMVLNKVNDVFNEFDAIISPTSPGTAFNWGEKKDDPIAVYLADIYTVLANLTGIPGASLPLYKHSNGLPFGLQVMTKKDAELPLLQLSAHLMQHYRAVAPE